MSSFKIITANLNGVRSAARKGFFAWLQTQDADVICLQELKAQAADMQKLNIDGLHNYHSAFHFAEKKGYSGVGIYSKQPPQQIVKGLGWDCADQEGRYVAIELDGFWVASLYMPSGTSGEHRQTIKFDFLDRYAQHLLAIRQQHKEFIICGDWNIAHQPIDLKNWRANQKNSGFLPEERAWLSKVFDEFGYIDAFRIINQQADQYTWWSQRGRARENNVGWRIDYQITTPGMKSRIKSAQIYTNEQFSDHAPLIMEYDR